MSETVDRARLRKDAEFIGDRPMLAVLDALTQAETERDALRATIEQIRRRVLDIGVERNNERAHRHQAEHEVRRLRAALAGDGRDSDGAEV